MNLFDLIRDRKLEINKLTDNEQYHKYYEIIINFDTNLNYLSKCFIGKSELSQEEIIEKTIQLKKNGSFPLPTDIDPDFKMFPISQYELYDNIINKNEEHNYKFFFTEKIINKFGYKKKYKDLTFFSSF